MKISFLKKLRKFSKSIGKFEDKFYNKIIKEKHKKDKKIILENDCFLEIEKKNFSPEKIAIVICFFYRSNRLNILKKNLLTINEYKFKTELTIITNNISVKEEKILNVILKKKIKNYTIKKIKDLPDQNFLPWHSLDVMKKKIKNKSFSHFMYLEEDILVNENNISYWIYFRKKLKKFNLIPNFLRCELYKGKYFSVDNPKIIKKDKNPVIYSKNKRYGFINSKYPYSGMYLMDRDLLSNYLKSNATKIDFSFTNRVMKTLYPIKELVNISYAYLNVPEKYHNKLAIPFKDNTILKYCIIEHADLKYIKHKELNKMGYGLIEVKSLIS